MAIPRRRCSACKILNDDTPAVDVIKEVGPGGNYLGHEHAVKYLRKVCWFSKIVVRDRYETWKATGSKDMRQRANEMARKILADTIRPTSTTRPRPNSTDWRLPSKTW